MPAISCARDHNFSTAKDTLRSGSDQMTASSTLRVTISCLFGMLLLLSYESSAVESLEGRILDDKTGQPVAATLLLSDGEGKPLEVEGTHSHVQYLGKR